MPQSQAQKTGTPNAPELMQEAHFDVLIVGAGMVGATLACRLAGSGLRVGLLDNRPLLPMPSRPAATERQEPRFEPRVSAISPASRSIFERIGVWEGIVSQRLCPYTDMHVWEADGTASIHFSAADIHAAELGYIVENQIVLAALHERLRNLEGVEIVPPGLVTDLNCAAAQDDETILSPAVVTLADDRRLAARLLVAADGASSQIRELAGLKVRQWDYQHEAIVTTVRTARPHAQTAIQRFMDDGVLAFLPLQGAGDADQHYCSIVWSVVPERAAQLMSMDETAFCHALYCAIEKRLGTIEWADARHAIPLHQRHATDYVLPGLALIGDAAHSIHPLAGQGVNLGLLDAWSLATQISRARLQQRDFAGLRVLKRYQRARKGHNLTMMWVMEAFKRLYADQPPALRWLRNAGMRQVDATPMIRNRIMRQALGTSLLDDQ